MYISASIYSTKTKQGVHCHRGSALLIYVSSLKSMDDCDQATDGTPDKCCSRGGTASERNAACAARLAV